MFCPQSLNFGLHIPHLFSLTLPLRTHLLKLVLIEEITFVVDGYLCFHLTLVLLSLKDNYD